MTARPLLAAIAILAAWALVSRSSARAEALRVDPAELTKHPEWIGRELEVEDRVRYFQGNQFEEMVLKRSNVHFRLPARLRPSGNGEIQVAQVRGVLKREPGDLYFDVTSLQRHPRDPERLEQGVRPLRDDDAKGRHAWAIWAKQRGEIYDDPTLTNRARDLEWDAIQIEASHPPADDPSAQWLALAHRARAWPIPEPTPSALAYRAYRQRLGSVATADEADRLAREIEAFFPEASKPAPEPPPIGAVADPEAAYRRASAGGRAALARQLWADATGRALELRADEPSADVLALADRARQAIPDRPEVADHLADRSIDAAFRDIGPLRRDELDDLARRLEARGQLARANDLRRLWLDDQRDRLSASDADGRVLLADQFSMLGDAKGRATARDLLLEALAIDPSYRKPEQALRQLGFRKSDDRWVDSRPTAAPEPADPGESSRAAATGLPLHGLTRKQVEGQLGRPTGISRTATQGLIVEQWTYPGLRTTQYINFIRRPTMTEPVVDEFYSLP